MFCHSFKICWVTNLAKYQALEMKDHALRAGLVLLRLESFISLLGTTGRIITLKPSATDVVLPLVGNLTLISFVPLFLPIPLSIYFYNWTLRFTSMDLFPFLSSSILLLSILLTLKLPLMAMPTVFSNKLVILSSIPAFLFRFPIIPPPISPSTLLPSSLLFPRLLFFASSCFLYRLHCICPPPFLCLPIHWRSTLISFNLLKKLYNVMAVIPSGSSMREGSGIRIYLQICNTYFIFLLIDTTINTTIALSNGPHTIGFWAHGSGLQTSFVDIYSIVVTGTRDGGASTCTPCPPGYYQNATKQNHCVKCELGYYANTTGSTTCTICPGSLPFPFLSSPLLIPLTSLRFPP